MRLWVGRSCGLWSISMVKLVLGAGSLGTGVGSGLSAKSTVCQVRTGWVEAEEFVEDDLELVFGERWFHILNAVYVGQPRDVVEEGWCGPGDYFLVDLEGCPTADFPSV